MRELWTMEQEDAYGNAENPEVALQRLEGLLKPFIGSCVIAFDPDDESGRDQLLFNFPTKIERGGIQQVGNKLSITWQSNNGTDCQVYVLTK